MDSAAMKSEADVWIAVKNDDKKALKYGVLVSVNVSAMDKKNDTPWHWAVQKGYTEIAK